MAAVAIGSFSYLLFPVRCPGGATHSVDLPHKIRRLRSGAPSYRRIERDTNRHEVIDFAGALVALLQVGHSPLAAWYQLGCASSLPGSSGHGQLSLMDPIAAMRTAAKGDGCEGLERIAICWDLAESSGVGLSLALRRLMTTLRSEREIAAEVETQLSAPRATVRLLMTLPLIAVAMGQSLGANPLAVLLSTAHGLICLVAGVALSVAGWMWTERQIGSVNPRP